MKVLSIRQPWATLISEELKVYEFRTWNTNFRGEFLIHASSGVDADAMKLFSNYGYNFPKGCIIAKACLDDVIKVSDNNRERIYNLNKQVYKRMYESNFNGYAYKLSNVKKISPIYIDGKLGFWDYQINELNQYQEMLGINKMPDFLNKYLEVDSIKRLKNIGYFCGMDYASKNIYNFGTYVSRFDHSLNVALIAWKFTHDKFATIAGLIHDIATPTFAHVIDYMNGDYENQESTEEYTKSIILGDKKLLKFLKEDNIDVNEIIDFKKYSIVDNDRPKLCADRFDGIILPALFWTKTLDISSAKKLVDSLEIYVNEFKEKELGFNNIDSALLAVSASKDIDIACHSDYDNYMMDLLANIVKRAIDIGLIEYRDLYYYTEKKLISMFKKSNDKKLISMLDMFFNIDKDDIKHIDLGKIKIRNIKPLVDSLRI